MSTLQDTAPAPASTARAAHYFAAQAQGVQRSVSLSEAQANALYTRAYQLSEQGRYDQANVVLALLMLYRADDPKYTLASAICFRKAGCYEDAIGMLARTIELNPDDPGPTFQMAECLGLLGRHGESLGVLEAIAEVAEAHGDHEVVERATALLEFHKVPVQ